MTAADYREQRPRRPARAGSDHEVSRQPVVVLAYEQSGARILRRLIDADKEIMCFDGGSLVTLSRRLVETWRGIEQSTQSKLSDLAMTVTRNMINVVLAPVLAGHGKVRWCDVSLGSAPAAKTFAEIYPEARFICLHRDCLDAINAILSDSPWGIFGNGMSLFAAAHAGNNVAALANYWATHEEAMAEFRRSFPARCHDVRFEDLLEHSADTADGLFEFLGSAPPDLATWEPRAHQAPENKHEVPVDLVPRHLLAKINTLLEDLSYQPIRIPR